MTDKAAEPYMSSDAKEVLNVLRGAIDSAKHAGVREVNVNFYQTHMNAGSTEVALKVRL